VVSSLTVLGLFHGDTLIFDYHFIFSLFEVLFNYIILFYIYTWILVIKSTLLNELRCWKVENLDDDRSDENKNEGGANSNGLQACVVGM
jgi:hypothetical protein